MKTANAGSNNYTKYGAYFGHNGPDADWSPCGAGRAGWIQDGHERRYPQRRRQTAADALERWYVE